MNNVKISFTFEELLYPILPIKSMLINEFKTKFGYEPKDYCIYTLDEAESMTRAFYLKEVKDES